MIKCPVCDQALQSVHGCSMHIINKEDQEHEDFNADCADKTELERKIILEEDQPDRDTTVEYPADQPDADADQQDGLELPSFPEGKAADHLEELESSPDCCSNPQLEGSEGDMYRVGDGRALRLEAGEQICTNCDHIHE